MAKGTVNKVIILGRLGQDPEVRATSGGMQVATLNVATNELGQKDQGSGQRQIETEWHRCVLFGKTAENAAAYLKKGSQVYLEGRLRTRKWQDKNTGQDRYSTEILCNDMQFIGGRSDSSQSSDQFANQQGFNQPPQQRQAQPNQGFNQPAPQPAQQNSGFDDFDDDIPF